MNTMQIDEICRACLREDDKMIDMPEKGTYQKFLLFVNLPVEEEIPDIPFNLCESCGQKLNISLKFKEECQKSHEILSNYIKNTCAVKSEVVDIDEPDLEATDFENTCEVKTESTDGGPFEFVDSEATSVMNTCEVKLEATYADALELVDSEATDVEIKDKSVETDADAKKMMRLKQFSLYEVQEALKELKQKFYENKNCIRCNYVGNNSRSLSQHISRSHKDLRPRWCYACNGEFDNLTDHIETNHNADYTCKFCSKNFQFLTNLNSHLRFHSVVKSFQCLVCEKSFNSQSSLRKHSLLHESEGDADKQLVVARQNFCVKCNKKVRSLLAHTKQVHTTCDDDDGNHSCTVCEKQFKTALRLKVHMRVHSSEASYTCTYCDKKFKAHNNLVKHERTHTGERPHVCEVCEKGFAQSNNLKIHMMVHHNIGSSISCNICSKKFTSTFQLRVHLRRHTGETPYVCTECGKAFIGRKHLVQHNKTHSDLRPYKCSYCNQTFKKNSSLNNHMGIHSGEKPYKCNQCSYACRENCVLKRHMKIHVVDKSQPDGHTCA